jgi:hypothetical protein
MIFHNNFAFKNAALGQFSASAVIFSLISASLVLSPLLLV